MPGGEIGSWIASCQNGVAPVTRSDRHVDTLDSRYRDPDRWVEGGTTCFASALKAAAEGSEPCVLALEFFLEPGSSPFKGKLARLEDLDGHLGHTPPLIVFYRPGAEPDWASANFRKLDDVAWPFAGSSGRIYLQEWHDAGNDEFDRRLWLVATPS